MSKENDFCLVLGKCWFRASHYKMRHLLLFHCCFICNSVRFARKYTVLLSAFQRHVSTAFFQSAVDARRHGQEISNSSAVAEILKLPASRSYGYQIMDRSRHTVTKFLSGEKTLAATKSKLLKKLDHVSKASYEVELATTQVENEETITVGFFLLQYAKLRTLKLYYNFWPKFVM